jgi:outer membrane protein OmpA-like peptidoglycan-associated protein
MRKSLIAASLLALSVAVAPACATKKYVKTEVGNVNSKVDTLSGTVEQTQARIQQDEGRIGDVDKKAEAAGQSAQAAQNSANQANQAAQQVNGRVTQVAADVAAGRKLMYEVTLNDAEGNFKFGKKDLPDDAKAKIDMLVGQLKGQQGKDLYIEIEGHTDNVGDKQGNYELGMQRAEAVRDYLYTQHQIPLHKISVFTYGEEKPVAPNNTKEGRAENRRVDVRLMSNNVGAPTSAQATSPSQQNNPSQSQ